MGQHFNVANENNHTGSLKILSSERKALIGHFTVYAFCIRPKYKAYYDLKLHQQWKGDYEEH